MILAIRTDKPEAELYLLDAKGIRIDSEVWLAHRQLTETLHLKIETLLKKHGQEYADLGGIIAYAGPGSFTGLRIGLSVANALAYGLDIPVAAAGGEDWLHSATTELSRAKPGDQVLPIYGGEANITKPRK